MFFEELGATATEYFGEGRVVREVIDREQPYLPQLRANLDRDDPSHVVMDVRTSGQTWRRSLVEALGVGVDLRRGVTPSWSSPTPSTGAQRWQAATPHGLPRRGASPSAGAEIVRPIFPHPR